MIISYQKPLQTWWPPWRNCLWLQLVQAWHAWSWWNLNKSMVNHSGYSLSESAIKPKCAYTPPQTRHFTGIIITDILLVELLMWTHDGLSLAWRIFLIGLLTKSYLWGRVRKWQDMRYLNSVLAFHHLHYSGTPSVTRSSPRQDRNPIGTCPDCKGMFILWKCSRMEYSPTKCVKMSHMLQGKAKHAEGISVAQGEFSAVCLHIHHWIGHSCWDW